MSNPISTRASQKPISSWRACALPLSEWPQAEGQAWLAATKPRLRLGSGGAASHLKKVSQNDLQRRYAYFLYYLKFHDILEISAPAAAQVTPKNVTGYIEAQYSRVSSVTLSRSIDKLARMTKLLAPHIDFSWLDDVAKNAAALASPRSKGSKVIDSARIVSAGLLHAKTAMDRTRQPTITDARQVRNGLMIALLALCPIRLKNFTALELGKHYCFDGSLWWVVLSAEETKSGRPDQRPVPAILNKLIHSYVFDYRDILTRSTNSPPDKNKKPGNLALATGPLWIESNHGRKMSYAAVEHAIANCTRECLGITLRPHMFRVCAASSVAYNSANNPNLASALLQHSDPRVTERHYNRASSVQAAVLFESIVNKSIKFCPEKSF